MNTFVVPGILFVAAVVALLLAWRLRASAAGVTLEPGAVGFRGAFAVEALARPLQREGFRDGGTFRVRETKAALRVLFHTEEGVYAVIHDATGSHPAYLELVTFYAEGGTATWTTGGSRPGTSAPEHVRVAVAGAGPAALLVQFLAERPEGTMLSATPRDFRSRYEAARSGAARGVPRREGPVETVAAAGPRAAVQAKSDVWGFRPR